MKRIIAAAVGAVLAAASLSSPATAQGAPQTIASVDIHTLATGYRASNIIGSTVVNGANEAVGKVDDLIVSRDHNLYAVVSVGGFLGLGKRLIAVPYAQLHALSDNRGFMLPGATKDALKRLPEYKYAS